MKKLGIFVGMALMLWGCAGDDTASPTLTDPAGAEGSESSESGEEASEVEGAGEVTTEGAGGTEEGGEEGEGGSGNEGGNGNEGGTGNEGGAGGTEQGGESQTEGGVQECVATDDCAFLNTDCSSAICSEGECVVSNNTDGSQCGAEMATSSCISGFECQAGQCLSVKVEDGIACDEGEELNECQESVCVGGSCMVQPAADLEGQPCTELGDLGVCAFAQCSEGECAAIPVADDTDCDDGTVCTAGAKCLDGNCKSAIEAPCDDGSACTSDDKCLDAECIGQQKNCDDGDACTIDGCDGETGECFYENDTETPSCPYYDGDGDDIFAKDDNCPMINNPKQVDWNGDNTGDACEVNACLNSGDVATFLGLKQTHQANGGQGNTPEQEAIFQCMGQCSGNNSTCTMAECVSEKTGLSPECGGCLAFSQECQSQQCSEFCYQGAEWSLCEACVEEQCSHVVKACTGLGQPKPAEGCPASSEEYCNGTCWPAGWFDASAGNGMCEEAMACESKGFDGGDCQENGEQGGQCGGGSVPDCLDGCVLPESLGNGSCEPFLNCSETGWDGGDCTPSCDSGFFLDCDLVCIAGDEVTGSLSDGQCNESLNCESYTYDGGDCSSSPCGSGEVQDCGGTCSAWSGVSAKLGNDECDMEFICEAWSNDMGKCDGSCLTEQDISQLEGKGTNELSGPLQGCFFTCGIQESGECATNCIMEKLGITLDCSFCFAEFGACIFQNCGLACQSDPTSQQCVDCTENNCNGPLGECSGLVF